MAVKAFLKKAKQIQEDVATGKTKRSKRGHGHGDDDESIWLTSYADLMTLTAAFFIMMMSMATFNAPKFEKVKEEVARHFGGDYESPNKHFAKFVTQLIQELGIEKDVVISSDPTGVSLVFHSTIFFDTLSSGIKNDGQSILEKLIKGIQGRQDAELKTYKIVVEGHTDSRPVVSGIYPSNWELSGARAARVVRLFIDKGFSAQQLIAIGYGDTRPRFSERGTSGEWLEENLAKNRRVVIRILEPKVDTIPWEAKGTAPAGPTPASVSPAPAPATAVPATTTH